MRSEQGWPNNMDAVLDVVRSAGLRAESQIEMGEEILSADGLAHLSARYKKPE